MKVRASFLSAALGIAAVSAVLTASPAQAWACNNGTAVTNNSSYAGQFTYKYQNYNLRSGPSTSCSTVDTVPAGTQVYGWCGLQINGVWWGYIRIAGTQTKGWTSQANLTYQAEGQWGFCP
ncbi:hypothetical protein ABGB12_24725 [Actinocorallia sp. B10E7]|uniref:hypothetical protein n=1 Tax=Actinocorallia sp. B10E7 TaxID=3153558 RepID=UPI00325E798D